MGGACFERKGLEAETQFSNFMLKLKITGICFTEIAKKIINKSEKSKEEESHYTITEENYLSIVNSYSKNADKEIYQKINTFLVEAEKTKSNHLTTKWALNSVLLLSNNSYNEKVNFFHRTLFLNDINQILDEKIVISSESKSVLSSIKNQLTEYITLHIQEDFNSFVQALNSSNLKFVQSAEYLMTKVYTKINIEHYITKLFNLADFSKLMESEVCSSDIINFLDTNRHIFVFSEFRPQFSREYD